MTDVETIKKNLGKRGLLIDSANIQPYLKRFPNFKEEMGRDLVNRAFWEEKRVLITGVSGFVGSHLAEKLLELGATVSGFIRRHAVPQYPNITKIMENINLQEGDLNDFDSIQTAIDSFEPNVIFHLAAQSFVPTSFRMPIETYQTNIIGTANLLKAVREAKTKIDAVQIAGSSEEYGMVYPEEVPITEKNPLRPQSPYAASKVSTDYIAQVYYRAYGIPAKITRAFNHTGPRRGLQFVTSVIARQIARAGAKGENVVRIGNPNPIRDFSDVRDIIQGYMLVVEKGKFAEPYNLGHGFGISIEDLVKLTANVSGVKIRIEVDQSRFRPTEVDILICDYSKAKEELGYKPRIPLTKTMSDNVEYLKENPQLLNIERH